MKRYRSAGGFAYIEALILTMLVSTAAMLVMSGFREAQRLNQTAAVRTAALQLANAKIAEAQYDLASTVAGTETFTDFMGGMTVVFDVEPTIIGNQVTVTVTPKVNGKDWEPITVERVVINRST